MEKVDSFVVLVTYRTVTPELSNFLIATFDWFINWFPTWQVPLRSINASFILLEHLIWWLIGLDQLTEKLLRKIGMCPKMSHLDKKRENSWRVTNIIHKVRLICDSYGSRWTHFNDPVDTRQFNLNVAYPGHECVIYFVVFTTCGAVGRIKDEHFL